MHSVHSGHTHWFVLISFASHRPHAFSYYIIDLIILLNLWLNHGITAPHLPHYFIRPPFWLKPFGCFTYFVPCQGSGEHLPSLFSHSQLTFSLQLSFSNGHKIIFFPSASSQPMPMPAASPLGLHSLPHSAAIFPSSQRLFPSSLQPPRGPLQLPHESSPAAAGLLSQPASYCTCAVPGCITAAIHTQRTAAVYTQYWPVDPTPGTHRTHF